MSLKRILFVYYDSQSQKEWSFWVGMESRAIDIAIQVLGNHSKQIFAALSCIDVSLLGFCFQSLISVLMFILSPTCFGFILFSLHSFLKIEKKY